jgi:hypothetical protein
MTSGKDNRAILYNLTITDMNGSIRYCYRRFLWLRRINRLLRLVLIYKYEQEKYIEK